MDNKTWILIASVLLALGLIIFAVVMSALGWDFTKLNTSKYETNSYDITEAFDGIAINADTADIRFVPSNDGSCRVVCYEKEKVRHEVSVIDGALTVVAVDNRAWYEHIEINFSTPSVTVYLPEGEYGELFVRATTGSVEMSAGFAFENIEVEVSTGDVSLSSAVTKNAKIKTSTGSITVDGITAEALEFSTTTGGINLKNARIFSGVKASASTGTIKLSDTECDALAATASTGSIYLTDTVAKNSFRIEVGTGGVHFDSCDAAEIYVRTSTGSVTGSLLTGKDFEAHSSTGRVDVPEGTVGGLCDIETGTGDIRISIIAAPQ